MRVEIRLFATLSKYLPHKDRGNSCSVEVNEKITVGKLFEQLKIPSDEVKTIFLNGVHATGHEILNEGDRIGVFPPIGGG